MAKCTIGIISASITVARGVSILVTKHGYRAGLCNDMSDNYPIYIIDMPYAFDNITSAEKCVFLYSRQSDKIVRNAVHILEKPFDHGKLIAAVDLIYDGICNMAGESIIVCGNDLIYKNKSVSLTGREMELYLFLSENAGVDISREDIVGSVWKNREIKTNIADVYVNYLRTKLKCICEKEVIEASRGVGYKFLLP